MNWEQELDEVRRREALARKMGGPDKVRRQHDGGKLTVRERIAAQLDADSFHETGALTAFALYDAEGRMTGCTPANLVTGRGRIDARPVVVCGDDFTVRGGANDAGMHEKLVHAEQMAHELRLPLVRLVDGTGGGGSVKTIEQKGRSYLPRMAVWDLVVRNMATVPVVSLALGSVAGMGSARVAASHYSMMVKDSSQLFVAGPPVVARIGEKHRTTVSSCMVGTRVLNGIERLQPLRSRQLCQVTIKRSKWNVSRLAPDLENQTVRETQGRLPAIVLQSRCDGIGILQRELLELQQHVDCSGDRGGAALVGDLEYPGHLGEGEERNPGAAGDVGFRDSNLLGVVAYREPHDDVRVNGAHAFCARTPGHLPSVPRASCVWAGPRERACGVCLGTYSGRPCARRPCRRLRATRGQTPGRRRACGEFQPGPKSAPVR